MSEPDHKMSWNTDGVILPPEITKNKSFEIHIFDTGVCSAIVDAERRDLDDETQREIVDFIHSKISAKWHTEQADSRTWFLKSTDEGAVVGISERFSLSGDAYPIDSEKLFSAVEEHLPVYLRGGLNVVSFTHSDERPYANGVENGPALTLLDFDMGIGEDNEYTVSETELNDESAEIRELVGEEITESWVQDGWVLSETDLSRSSVADSTLHVTTFFEKEIVV